MEKLKEKTEYCLNCKLKPCQSGCPLGNDIPQVIEYANVGEYKKAFDVLCKTTVMPYICGRICPKTKQCQGKCVRGIKGNPVSIGEIESAIGDMAIDGKWYLNEEKPASNGKKVAIVGGGPAGITASIFLARAGWNVTVFEKHDRIGGILRYGIPSFRLDKKYVDFLEEYMRYIGITIVTKSKKNVLDLREKYNAILVTAGANVSNKTGTPGEDLPNVYGANELLEYENHPDYTEKNIIIIGGGNVAIDAARTVKRLGGKEVTVVYRRGREQMPAEVEEVKEAENEGINFLFQTKVTSINDGRIDIIETELVKKEGEDRPVPVDIPNSNKTIRTDYVILAVGSKLDCDITEGLEVNDKNYIKVNETYKTSVPNVYAAGDCIGEKATVAWACQSGKKAALEIIRTL